MAEVNEDMMVLDPTTSSAALAADGVAPGSASTSADASTAAPASGRKRRRGALAGLGVARTDPAPRTPRTTRRTVSMAAGAASASSSNSSASPSTSSNTMPPPLPIPKVPSHLANETAPEPLASASSTHPGLTPYPSSSEPLSAFTAPRRRGRFLSLAPVPTSCAFDLIVVGCGGGPCEDNLSAYFLKSSSRTWEEGFVGLEGGSGLGAVRKLLEEEEVDHPGLVGTVGAGKKKWKGKRKGGPFYDFEAVRQRNQALAASASARPLNPSIPFTPTVPSSLGSFSASAFPSSLPLAEDPPASELDPSYLSGHIYASLQGYLLSHAHFDHMASLVLSAGALTKCPKEVWGIESTCVNVMKVFDGGVWPKLAARESRRGWPLWIRRMSLADEVDDPSPTEVSLCPSLTARAFRVAHGVLPESTPHPSPSKPQTLESATSATTTTTTTTTAAGCCGEAPSPPSTTASSSRSLVPGMPSPHPYESTAFFITDAASSRVLLFFGDVGPDSVSGLDWNRRVWEEAAAKFAKGQLAAVFLECSYPSSRKEDQLYGHLSPPFLFEELAVLASLCPPADGASGPSDLTGRLAGLPVVIIHVKDDTWPLPVSVAPPTPHPLGPGKVPAHDSMRDWIGHEIEELEGRWKLGCRFVMARQGDRMQF